MAPEPLSPWDTPPASRAPPDFRSSSTVTTLSSSSHSRSPRSSHSRSPRISDDSAPSPASPRQPPPPAPTVPFEHVDDDQNDLNSPDGDRDTIIQADATADTTTSAIKMAAPRKDDDSHLSISSRHLIKRASVPVSAPVTMTNDKSDVTNTFDGINNITSVSTSAVTTRYLVDEFADPDSSAPSVTQQPSSCRTLPRCGVVNFQKDGDNLCWAPRVTHNSSGVAARVHNFEDAFSLEEFSSTALPVLWQSKGGNPRMSGMDREPPLGSLPDSSRGTHSNSNRLDLRASRFIGGGGALGASSRRARDRLSLASKQVSSSQPSSPRPRSSRGLLGDSLPASSPTSRACSPAPRSTPIVSAVTTAAAMHGEAKARNTNVSTQQSSQSLPPSPQPPQSPASLSTSGKTSKRFKSVSPVRSMVRSGSVKRTIALANELRRPSFWSLLAHTKKYQKAKARARVQAEDTKRLSRGTARHSGVRDGDSGVLRRREGGSGAATAAHPALRKKSLGTDGDGTPRPQQTKPWVGLSSTRRSARPGRGTRAGGVGGGSSGGENDGRRSGSLFKKFVEHLERRNGASEIVEESEVGDRGRVGGRTGAEKIQADKEKSDGKAARTRSRWGHVWSGSDGGVRGIGMRGGKRTKSTLQSEGADGANEEGGDRAVVNVQEDQYVTFITSVV